MKYRKVEISAYAEKSRDDENLTVLIYELIRKLTQVGLGLVRHITFILSVLVYVYKFENSNVRRMFILILDFLCFYKKTFRIYFKKSTRKVKIT